MADMMFENAKRFYELLEANSIREPYDGIPMQLFKGSLVDLYKHMDIGQSYYGPINSALRETGCVTLLRRGARGSSTILALHHAPTELEFALLSTKALTRSPEAAKLLERMGAIERRIGGADIGEALANLDERLTLVERKLREVANGTES